MKLTVNPAKVPARPCPTAGSLLGFVFPVTSSLEFEDRAILRNVGLEKTFSRSKRRYKVREPSMLSECKLTGRGGENLATYTESMNIHPRRGGVAPRVISALADENLRGLHTFVQARHTLFPKSL